MAKKHWIRMQILGPPRAEHIHKPVDNASRGQRVEIPEPNGGHCDVAEPRGITAIRAHKERKWKLKLYPPLVHQPVKDRYRPGGWLVEHHYDPKDRYRPGGVVGGQAKKFSPAAH